MIRRILFFILIPFLFSCGADDFSSLEGLGASPDGNNVALLIGAPNGLSGVPTDMREMPLLLSKPDFRFRVVKEDNATADEALALVRDEAAHADSLLFYFSGHGTRGNMLMDDRPMAFFEVAEAIQAVRRRPLARLLVVVDSCYSGSFVDGGDAIVTEPSSETGSNFRESTAHYEETLDANPNLYDQAFIFSASKSNELAADLGAERGGAFTYTFRTLIGDWLTERPLATFRDVAEEISRQTEAEFDHTPMWRAFPRSVMDDFFYFYAKEPNQ